MYLSSLKIMPSVTLTSWSCCRCGVSSPSELHSSCWYCFKSIGIVWIALTAGTTSLSGFHSSPFCAANLANWSAMLLFFSFSSGFLMMCARTLTTESEESRALISCQIEVMMLKCLIGVPADVRNFLNCHCAMKSWTCTKCVSTICVYTQRLVMWSDCFK